MASLQRFSSNGKFYYRIVESRRVNGKPRPIPVLYIGNADQLLQRLRSQSNHSFRLRSYAHGAVAALKAISDELGIISVIDQFVPRSRHKLSVGTTLLLAAINRAVCPRSKMGWARWAQDTSIEKFFPFQVEELTSQYFWDQMDLVSETALEQIEDEITRRVVALTQIPLDLLFYDPTNFFTYIDSTNPRPKLARRGKSKQHRNDLRQFTVALLISREGGFPLCSRVYPGNVHDSTAFPDSITQVRQRLERLSGQLQDLTLVYDRGNNSKANQALVDQQQFHYVGGLVLKHFPELAAIPLNQYRTFTQGSLQDILYHRSKKTIWGSERTLVLYISPDLQAGQIHGLRQHLAKSLQQLQTWKEVLAKPHSGPRQAENVQATLQTLTRGQHLCEILSIQYHPQKTGSDRLTWQVDQKVQSHLETEVFGKRLLMTNRHDWSTEEIIQAYRGQSQAESAFRQLKDPEHLALRPQYHWTDQKIRVHTFLCLMAFMLARILEWRARKTGYTQELSSLLDILDQIRLALILKNPGKEGGRPLSSWQLEEASPQAMKLFRLLVPSNPQFVYTPQTRGGEAGYPR